MNPGRMGSRSDLSGLDERVADLEEWQGECIGTLSRLQRTVGEEPTDEIVGSGLAKDVKELKATIGEEPSTLRKTDGTGMARTIHEIHKWMSEERDRRVEQEKKPAALLRRLQTVAVIVGLVISTATVLSGCTAAATWFVRVAVHNTGAITQGKP